MSTVPSQANVPLAAESRDQESLRNVHYYPWIDVLRAVCFLMVFGSHFTQQFELGHVSWFSRAGVSLFFVISGWLITKIIVRTVDRPGFFSTFYARRFLRIAPVYYLAVILYLIASPFMPAGSQGHFLEQLPNFLTFNYGLFPLDGALFNHAWSIAVEERFYLVWPLMAMLSHRLKMPYWIVLVTALLLSTGSLFSVPQATPAALMPALPSSLLFGCLLALYGGRLKPLNGYWHLLLTVVCFGLFALSCATFGSYFPLSGLMGMLCVWCCTTTQHAMPKPLGILAKLGELSYGTYLFHMFFLYAAREGADKLHLNLGPVPIALLFLFSYIATVAFAMVINVGLETPILKLRTWIQGKQKITLGLACLQMAIIPAGIVLYLIMSHFPH